MTADGDVDAFAAIRRTLAPFAGDPAEPAWVRDALGTAVALLDEAAAGTLAADDAAARVGALIELVMTGGDPAPATGDRAASAGPARPFTGTRFVMPDDAARELFPEFVAESLAYMEDAESALLELERDPSNGEAVNIVFRAFHTIKSTSAFLGLLPVSELAHRVESLLCPVRDGIATFSPGIADIALDGADLIRDLVHRARAGVDDGVMALPEGYAAVLRRIAEADRGEHAATLDPAADEDAIPLHDAGTTAREAGRNRTGRDDEAARVPTERLDQLLDLVGELVVAQAMVAGDPTVGRNPHGDLRRKVTHAGKIVRQLQDLSMSLRMVPLRPLFQRLRRLVRELARESGREVEFVTTGDDTEIDRRMVELLADPLIHMVRNAVDHGIEAAGARAAAGKPEAGTLRLTACHASGSVVVELTDDGRGLDLQRIVDAAVRRGLVTGADAVAADEAAGLIFAPGLSTAGQVTALSGRGVGMDVVRRNIEAMGGRVEVFSEAGRGTRFTLRLPLTLALTDGMLVRVGTERYIIPMTSIYTSFRPTPDAVTAVAGRGELATLHGSVVPILRLHALFDVPDAVTDPTRAMLVVIDDGLRRHALLVDELLGQHQLVAKPLGGGIGTGAGLTGAAVLSDGRVGLILDPAGLIDIARDGRPRFPAALAG
jgi:two-component system, chemotaxis family, sensor kinase CheA